MISDHYMYHEADYWARDVCDVANLDYIDRFALGDNIHNAILDTAELGLVGKVNCFGLDNYEYDPEGESLPSAWRWWWRNNMASSIDMSEEAKKIMHWPVWKEAGLVAQLRRFAEKENIIEVETIKGGHGLANFKDTPEKMEDRKLEEAAKHMSGETLDSNTKVEGKTNDVGEISRSDAEEVLVGDTVEEEADLEAKAEVLEEFVEPEVHAEGEAETKGAIC
jgi:hypothetical protein